MPRCNRPRSASRTAARATRARAAAAINASRPRGRACGGGRRANSKATAQEQQAEQHEREAAGRARRTAALLDRLLVGRLAALLARIDPRESHGIEHELHLIGHGLARVVADVHELIAAAGEVEFAERLPAV